MKHALTGLLEYSADLISLQASHMIATKPPPKTPTRALLLNQLIPLGCDRRESRVVELSPMSQFQRELSAYPRSLSISLSP
jgi:hypothetical protein